MTTVPNRVIVDPSLALKWVVAESDSLNAAALLGEWIASGVEVGVPSWFSCETANALFRLVREGVFSVADALPRHTGVMAYVTVQPDAPADGAAAITLADQLRQRATYDSHYLALARRLGCELWTADMEFARAAVRIGYPVRTLDGV